MPASTRGTRRSLSCLATITAIIFGMPMSAQGTPPATEDAEALRAEVRRLREQLEAVERRLETLRTSPVAAPRPQPESAVRTPTGTPPPAAAAPGADAGVVATADDGFTSTPRYAIDVQSAPQPDPDRAADTPALGETRLRIGGFLKVDGTLDSGPIGTRDWFVPGTIPVEGPDTRRGGHAGLHTRASRLFAEWRRGSPLGTVRIYTEGNFLGGDEPTYRHSPHRFQVPQIYGQLGGWTLGRTFTVFMDLDAFPDTLDFYGPNAAAFVFNTQVRYTHRVGDTWFAASVETPRTLAGCARGIVCSGRDPLPDLAARLRREGPWGHLQLALLLRRLGAVSPGAGTDTTTGTGLLWTGSLRREGTRDYLVYGAHAGRGIARYINDPGYRTDSDGWLDATGTLHAAAAHGGYLGATHYWNARLRSTFTAGLSWTERGADPVSSRSRTTYTSGNLIADVIDELSLGVETLYGENDLGAARSAEVLRLMFSAQYRF